MLCVAVSFRASHCCRSIAQAGLAGHPTHRRPPSYDGVSRRTDSPVLATTCLSARRLQLDHALDAPILRRVIARFGRATKVRGVARTRGSLPRSSTLASGWVAADSFASTFEWMHARDIAAIVQVELVDAVPRIALARFLGLVSHSPAWDWSCPSVRRASGLERTPATRQGFPLRNTVAILAGLAHIAQHDGRAPSSVDRP